MRKLILSLLVASTAATSALAQDRGSSRRDRAAQAAASDDGERSQARAERQQQRAERQQQRTERQRTPREMRAERAQPAQVAPPAVAVQTEAPRRPRLARTVDGSSQQSRVLRSRRSNDSLAAQVIERRRLQNGGAVETRPARDDDRVRRYRDGDRQWSGQWRSDRRYDWRRHRDHNRSLFRFGRYYDPYRYGYRRFSVGYNLWPSYYGSNFWLNDPWQYRLPPAYGPYRWVRYYNDALLVNIYSGQVVDMIHNFFW